MRDACAADDPWQGYRQKFRVFFREAYALAMLRAIPEDMVNFELRGAATESALAAVGFEHTPALPVRH